jgi:SAM-dependent methyltransferase
MLAPVNASTAKARDALRSNPTWYHTIELAPGVVTPGHIDLRGTAERVLPSDLSGLRALDIGTFDGFWAFEMERRGAEVVAIDTDRISANEWPPRDRARLDAAAAEWGVELGRGFRIAAEALGSGAEHVTCDVYDLSPEVIGGEVDIAFCGALLLHLRDPVRALERIRATVRDSGELRLLEPISPALTALFPRRPAARFDADRTEFNWWVANLAALRAWCWTAGFAETRRLAFVRPPSVTRMRQLHVALSARGRAPELG